MVRNPDAPSYILIGPENNDRIKEVELAVAPRLDYRLVAEARNARIIECAPPPSALLGRKAIRLLRSLVNNFRVALSLFQYIPNGSSIYSTGETWGLPIALVGVAARKRSFSHVVYVHRVFSTTWLKFIDATNRFLAIDGWICVNKYQTHLLADALRNRNSKIAVISQGVDTQFYDPAKANATQQIPYILSVGAEMRNYPLFLEAVEHIELPIVLKASSTWMTQLREVPNALPSNVELIEQRLSYIGLRDLYAGAALVVVPLYDTPQAAGITTILESMAMGKPLIVTQSRGLPDGLVSGENCIVVDPAANQLETAIRSLLNNPAQMKAIADNGRRFVLENYTLEHHTQQVSDFLRAVSERK